MFYNLTNFEPPIIINMPHFRFPILRWKIFVKRIENLRAYSNKIETLGRLENSGLDDTRISILSRKVLFVHLSSLDHSNDPPKNVISLRARNVARPNAILMYELVLRKVDTVKSHRNAYIQAGGSGKNSFFLHGERERRTRWLSRVLEETGFRVSRLSSSRPRLSRETSSSVYTPGHDGDKEDPPGACLHPFRDFRATGVLAERLTFAFSEWEPPVLGICTPFNGG